MSQKGHSCGINHIYPKTFINIFATNSSSLVFISLSLLHNLLAREAPQETQGTELWACGAFHELQKSVQF